MSEKESETEIETESGRECERERERVREKRTAAAGEVVTVTPLEFCDHIVI